MSHVDKIIGVRVDMATKTAESYNWSHSRVDADLSALTDDQRQSLIDPDNDWHSQLGQIRDGGTIPWREWFALCESQAAEDSLKSRLGNLGIDYDVTDVSPTDAEKEAIRSANVLDRTEIPDVLDT